MGDPVTSISRSKIHRILFILLRSVAFPLSFQDKWFLGAFHQTLRVWLLSGCAAGTRRRNELVRLNWKRQSPKFVTRFHL
jgi:hypothetical protein